MFQLLIFLYFSITILDQNDSPPKLTLPSTCVQVTEFHDVKEIVATIKAKDLDDPNSPNGQVKFDIRGGTGADYFFIKQIDHWNANIQARHQLNGLYGNYSLIIIAKDLGMPQNTVEDVLSICIQG